MALFHHGAKLDSFFKRNQNKLAKSYWLKKRKTKKLLPKMFNFVEV
jgi:hypothetical protein